MAETYNFLVNENAKEKSSAFLKNIESAMAYKSDYSSDLLSTDWLDIIEYSCPFLDIIYRNAKIALIQEENVEKIERSKRINVSSIKDLARHSEYINKYDKKTDSVEPSKILDIRNEETFNIYENRFLYTLLSKLSKFLYEKEKMLNNFELSDEKYLEYSGNTLTTEEKVKVELKVYTETLPSQKIDKDIKDKIKSIKARLKRVKEYVSSWEKSEMVKALDKAHVSFINPPIKKTNIILKNPNFQVAVKLWEFLYKYEEDDDEKEENLNSDNSSDVLKGFLDHSFLIDYFVLSSIVSTKKREQKKELAKCASVLITEEIRRIIALLKSTGLDITNEELLSLIAKEIKNDKNERLVGIDDVKKKFKNAMEDYLERIQENL